ncbi:hypothetical protein BT69DRAFT_1327881 [Atractiella rhizophila]|nr:hypothetical protein BT69DRAFT_1327881 [Atractiella rhizophila]
MTSPSTFQTPPVTPSPLTGKQVRFAPGHQSIVYPVLTSTYSDADVLSGLLPRDKERIQAAAQAQGQNQLSLLQTPQKSSTLASIANVGAVETVGDQQGGAQDSQIHHPPPSFSTPQQNSSISSFSTPGSTFVHPPSTPQLQLSTPQSKAQPQTAKKQPQEEFYTHNLPPNVRPYAPEIASKARVNILASALLCVGWNYLPSPWSNNVWIKSFLLAFLLLTTYNSLASLFYLYGPQSNSSSSPTNSVRIRRDPRSFSPSKASSPRLGSQKNKFDSPRPLDYRLESPARGGGMGLKVGGDIIPLPASPSPNKTGVVGGVGSVNRYMGTPMGRREDAAVGSPLGNWRARRVVSSGGR